MKKNTRKLRLCMETLRELEAVKVAAGDDTPTVDSPTCRGLTCLACGVILGD